MSRNSLLEELCEAVVAAVIKSIDEHKADSEQSFKNDEAAMFENFFDEEILLDIIKDRVYEGLDEALANAEDEGDISINE